MSKYTTEVRYICENIAKKKNANVNLENVKQVVDLAWEDLVSLSEALEMRYDVTQSSIVEEHFIKVIPQIFYRNYTREICCETVGLWKLRLQNKLNTILPYYADMYETLELKFNPLIDTDVVTDETRNTENKDEHEISKINTENNEINKVLSENGNSETNGENETTTKNVDKYSDTPQGSLVNVETGEYLTNARIIDNSENNTSKVDNEFERNLTDNTTSNKSHDEKETSVTNGTTDSVSKITVKGKTSGATYSHMLKEYRKTIININEMFLEEFNELFMLIY